MARFDVYRRSQGSGYLLDCQADVLRALATRFVVPLMIAEGLPHANRLNPVFKVDGENVVMATQLASALDVRRLGERIDSLAEERAAIMNALDMLITGY